MISVTQSQKRILPVITLIAVIGGALFLRSYFLLIVLAAIVAYIFNPVYQRLLKKWGKPSSAASLTLLLSILVMVIPILIILTVSAFQVLHLVEIASNATLSANYANFLQNVVDSINTFLASIDVAYRLTVDAVFSAFINGLKMFGETLLRTIGSSISSVVGFFALAIIYMYVFLSMLMQQNKIRSMLTQLNPLGKDVLDLYVSRTESMTKAMVKGQFVIAIAQGFTDALLLYIAGMHSTFFFFFLLLSAFSVIPLGGGIIAIPIGVVMILTGNIWQGLVVILGHIFIVTNIDNVLRPRLVPKNARLDPALTILSVFSGLKLFGFLGIVLGPVLMILIVTTIQVFVEVFKQIESIDRSINTKRDRTLLKKIAFWKEAPVTDTADVE